MKKNAERPISNLEFQKNAYSVFDVWRSFLI